MKATRWWRWLSTDILIVVGSIIPIYHPNIPNLKFILLIRRYVNCQALISCTSYSEIVTFHFQIRIFWYGYCQRNRKLYVAYIELLCLITHVIPR